MRIASAVELRDMGVELRDMGTLLRRWGESECWGWVSALVLFIGESFPSSGKLWSFSLAYSLRKSRFAINLAENLSSVP